MGEKSFACFMTVAKEGHTVPCSLQVCTCALWTDLSVFKQLSYPSVFLSTKGHINLLIMSNIFFDDQC